MRENIEAVTVNVVIDEASKSEVLRQLAQISEAVEKASSLTDELAKKMKDLIGLNIQD